MRLYILQLGIWETPPPGMPPANPFPGYLIRADDGTNILVDTGFPEGMIGAYRRPGNAGPRVDEEDHVVNRLAALGLAPSDIRYLICTHFDMDQAGVRASTRKLVELARREGVRLIVHGHDPEQWRTLRRAPDFYA